ncbi:hypothetical protein BC940DRAFT_311459 [Gongronella butleri]|nr:hypothetical protein BC940DRAFT_311459 [Gongronella butleri]
MADEQHESSQEYSASMAQGLYGDNAAFSQVQQQSNNPVVAPTPVLLSPPFSHNMMPQQHASLSLSDAASQDFHMDSAQAGPSSFKPAPPKKGSGRGRKPAHELLTDEQKKANHIASEQKRRANIRIGFDQLVDIVPSLNESQRSESMILHKSAEYIRQLIDSKNALRDRVRDLQTQLGEVPDEDSSEGEMDYM